MTPTQAVAYIRQSNGRFLAVEFTKRSTGETRLMHCRTGVVRHLRGGSGSGAAYVAEEKGLITVWDLDKAGYRSIPIEGITAIIIGGIRHPVVPVQQLLPFGDEGPYQEGR